MLPIPLRMIFRNRWLALLWAGGICLGAVGFVGGDGNGSVDAANSATNASAQLSALQAEDPA